MQSGVDSGFVKENTKDKEMINPYYKVDSGFENSADINSIQNSTPRADIERIVFGETPNEKFFRGLLIGAIATYVMTNESAQKAIVKTGMKLYGAVAGGVEEFKEKIMDAKAEMEEEMSTKEG